MKDHIGGGSRTGLADQGAEVIDHAAGVLDFFRVRSGLIIL